MRTKLFISLATLIGAVSLITGCVKDSYREDRYYIYYVPVYKTAAEVISNIKSGAPTQVEKAGKLFIKGNYIFLNEVDKGVHIIDNSDPKNPRNISFVNIPGNLDLAVYGDNLYADMYNSLITIDISNPLAVRVKDVQDHIFPERDYGGFAPDSHYVIASWSFEKISAQYKDDNTAFLKRSGLVFMSPMAAYQSGSSNSTSAATSPYGMGGSMARFAFNQGHLYAVSTNMLRTFGLKNSIPTLENSLCVGWNIETIYPFKKDLFIGSQTGMFIYNLSNPSEPALKGNFQHATSCDPVIVDDYFAYITLRSGNTCNATINELDVLSITNPQSPKLVGAYTLKNPKGLSKDGNNLFVCDKEGVRIYNASVPEKLVDGGLIPVDTPYDVIANSSKLIVVGRLGLFQYDVSDLGHPSFLSSIKIAEK